ncbi:MAG: N-acetylneuraminate synthase family protein, partial [Candidatus Heimdallarchaeota archaeon]|nr:N-acetylneuraminate synthase family protein [Candidatus Heimdallarchaeota archaeon]
MYQQLPTDIARINETRTKILWGALVAYLIALILPIFTVSSIFGTSNAILLELVVVSGLFLVWYGLIILISALAARKSSTQVSVNSYSIANIILATLWLFLLNAAKDSANQDIELAAVSLGACIIEKHFTLDKGLPGPDHRFSADTAEFRELVEAVRAVESCLGEECVKPALGEMRGRQDFRLSCVAACDLPALT